MGELPDSKARASCDLDGVITMGQGRGPHDFAPVRPGATEFLRALHERYEEVIIHTARNVDAAKNYLRQNGLLKYCTAVTNLKLPSKIYIDDRGVPFRGDFAQTLKDIKDFEPFWKDAASNVGRGSASTQVDLPRDLAAKVLAMGENIPDDLLSGDGREAAPHVTLLYGITEDESTALPKLRRALKGFGQVRIRLGRVGMFEVPSKGFDVVKVDVVSEDLQRLRKKIEATVQYETDFPDYQPHVTIAYVQPGSAKRFVGDATLTGAAAAFTSLTFCTQGGNRVSISLV